MQMQEQHASIHPSMFGMRLQMNMTGMGMEIFTAVKIHTVIFWVWQNVIWYVNNDVAETPNVYCL